MSARPAFEDEAVQADKGVWGRSPQLREGAGLGSPRQGDVAAGRGPAYDGPVFIPIPHPG
ncbi:hypothetical protein GCM10010252_13190 [Streptomyces aureoverticillatus]|nr:hypothetical protein GCM10010252_13190 [Streptomyces aureoverticillatus]